MSQHTTLVDLEDYAIAAQGKGGYFFQTKKIDCSVNTLTSGESYAIFKIPAGTVLQGIMNEVITAEGGTATADIGLTGGDTDGIWDGSDSTTNALNLNDTAGTITVGAGDALAAAIAAQSGLLFASDDTIDLLANNTMDAAVFEISIWGIRKQPAV